MIPGHASEEERILGALGRTLRAAQDAALPSAPAVDVDRVRAMAARRTTQRRIARGGGLLAAACVLCALFFQHVHPGFRDAALSDLAFTSAGQRIAPGEVLRSETSSMELSASEGTSIHLHPQTRLALAAIGPQGARLRLEDGKLSAAVTHRSASEWHFLSGPYDVRVTGTRFELTWHASTARLLLVMREGSVVVTGPMLNGARTVMGGEVLDVSARDESAPQPATTSVNAVDGGETAARGVSAPATSRGASTSWRELLAAGRYAEAIADAERDGFAAQCNTTSAGDLARLADGARLASKLDYATFAYEALRRRFPDEPEAHAAAFALGKIAFDQRESYADASRWFAVYLREAPDGELAREALGRLIEARRQEGDDMGAADAARAYLARFPNGPHAPLARECIR